MDSIFYTLQDFLTLTKGQEYLIAIASIGVFTLFWVILERSSKKKKQKKDNV